MLEIKDLSLTVEGDKGPVQILKNINLSLERNKLYVFTGPNGGGKSSLAKVIMGIYQPTGGQILLDGQEITNMTVYERARLGLGYAFQQPPRFKGITVSQLLQLAAGTDKSIKGCGYLADVGLCAHDYLDREIDASLSGGELKRIEIATLLARELKVAMYDEPEAGIDLWSFSKLTETFQNVHKKYDTTLVIISHQERILNLADEIILVADGTIKEHGKKDNMWPLIMNDIGCTYFDNCAERDENSADCYR